MILSLLKCIPLWVHSLNYLFYKIAFPFYKSLLDIQERISTLKVIVDVGWRVEPTAPVCQEQAIRKSTKSPIILKLFQ